ncbi:MAG: glutamate--tRNA ligase [Candidatus Hydrothermarchaeales archaeon]
MRELIYKYALKNAHDYGKAMPKAVLGKVLAENSELKKDVKGLMGEIQEIIQEVNGLSPSDIAEKLKQYEFVEKAERKEGLPDLSNPKDVVLRFAPNPSGPLHLGHCRAAVLNDEYAKRYDGKFILRFEDTDPARVDPSAYDMISEDLKWLEVEVHQVTYQSDRLEVYYDHGRKLIELEAAYTCTCSSEDFRKRRDAKKACDCRTNSIEENLRRYDSMFAKYAPGEAVVRLKTGVDLPDPAMRDFVIIRISEVEHPRVKGNRVYPLYNFSVSVDDHLMGVSHVLRGKDHIINTKKQGFIYDYFGWQKPEFIHYGLLQIEDLELSTSLMAKGISESEYSGWEDVRLGTLQALRLRGIQPEAVRRAILDVGIKATDISFSWKNLYALNREIIDPIANRYSFVADPVELIIEDCPSMEVHAPLHPDHAERGSRNITIEAKDGRSKLYVSIDDAKNLAEGTFVRLMEAFNVVIESKNHVITARHHSRPLEEARRRKARLIQWVPEDNFRVTVVSPNGDINGLGEKEIGKLKAGDLIQFERFGFVRIDSVGEEIKAYFTHK